MSTLAFRCAIVCATLVQVLGGAIVSNQVGMRVRDLIDVTTGFPSDPRCLYGSLTQVETHYLCVSANLALAASGCAVRQCGCNSDIATSIENCYSCQLKVTDASQANITAAQAFMNTYVNQCNAAGYPVQQLQVNLNVAIRAVSASPPLLSPIHIFFSLGLLWLAYLPLASTLV